MAGRFDYVKYDEESTKLQAEAKDLCEKLEKVIDKIGAEMPPEVHSFFVGRSKSLALTQLETTYAWIGKAIRDWQRGRDSKTEMQEERKDS